MIVLKGAPMSFRAAVLFYGSLTVPFSAGAGLGGVPTGRGDDLLTVTPPGSPSSRITLSDGPQSSVT